MSVAFDTLNYTKGAEAVGIKREHAEYQAQQLANIANIIDQDLVTKSFLDIKLRELELRMIIKVGAMMVIQSGLIITIIGLLLRH